MRTTTYWWRRKRTPDDEIPRQILRLVLELLQSGELPELAVGGAWSCIIAIVDEGIILSRVALEANICGLAMAHLRALGPAADWTVSLSVP